MQPGKSSRTSILILLSPAGGELNPNEHLNRTFRALAALRGGPVTWILAQQTLADLPADARERLRTRVLDHGDDLVLQGAYGIPHGVLGDRELHFETNVSRRAAGRAIEVPAERIRDLIAPPEPDLTRLAAVAADRSALLGVSPHRRHYRLWIAADGRKAAIPLVRLDDVNLKRWWRRAAVLSVLRRGSPTACAVDIGSGRAVEQLERLAPHVTAAPLELPDARADAGAPERLEPLIPVIRTPIWHARLLAAAAARPKTRRGRVTAQVLRPFGAPPKELVRRPDGESPLHDNRVVHASMLGSARMTEGRLTVQFSGGTCVGLSTSPTGPFPVRPDPGSMTCGGREWPFRISGAFSFDWDTARGLTTRSVCTPGRRSRRVTESAFATEGPSMRVETDYLFLDDLPWLVVRATVHYPADGRRCHAQPVPLPLGRASHAADVALRAWRHDGGEWEPLGESGRERGNGSGSRFLRVPAAGMSVSIAGEATHIVFIDKGHGLTWEPGVQITGSGSRLDLYLLPFGRFETAEPGLTSASILLGMTRGDEVPDVEALRKRVLRILPAPSAIPSESAPGSRPHTESLSPSG
ncbi:MAG: hypothetical protein ACOCYG_00665 [Spirochaetota bacterium]